MRQYEKDCASFLDRVFLRMGDWKCLYLVVRDRSNERPNHTWHAFTWIVVTLANPFLIGGWWGHMAPSFTFFYSAWNWTEVPSAMWNFYQLICFQLRLLDGVFRIFLGAKTILCAAVVGVVLEGNSGALRQDRRDESTRQEHSIVGEVNQISKLKEDLHGNPSCHMFPLSLCTMTQHFQTNIVRMLPYDATRCSGSTKAWRIQKRSRGSGIGTKIQTHRRFPWEHGNMAMSDIFFVGKFFQPAHFFCAMMRLSQRKILDFFRVRRDHKLCGNRQIGF